VVDAKETFRLAGRVGAHHPRQAESAVGKGRVRVGDEELFAPCREGGEDCVVGKEDGLVSWSVNFGVAQGINMKVFRVLSVEEGRKWKNEGTK
jgi:hypothetical protein